MVANTFLAMTKPGFVIGVGRWRCGWS